MQSKVFFFLANDLRKVATSATLLMILGHFSTGRAQDIPQNTADEQKRAGFWVEPRITVGLTLTNNSELNAESLSEQALSISPGFRAIFNNARVKGSVDYSLTGLYYLQHTFDNSVQHLLDSSLNVNIWSDRAYVDVAGKIDRVAISAFGAQSINDAANPNLSESAQVRVSPYIKGYLGADTAYEGRYSFQTTRTDVANRSDYSAHDWLISIGNRDENQRVGWSLDARAQKFDYSLGRKTQSRSVEAGLSYAFTPVLRGSAFVGAESNDRVSLDRRSYNASGVGVDWRPSDSSRINIALDRRYYGNGHNVLLEHKSGRVVWRYTDIQSAMNNALEDAVPLLGANYDLLDSFYSVLEPDPIKRVQLIESELLKYGVPTTYELYRRFITSSATFERNQRLSALVEGVRSVTTFSLGRHKSRRLDAGVNLLGDDFDNTSVIFQRSWSVVYAHRVDPLTSVSISLSGVKTDSTNIALGDSSKSLALGMTNRLGLRTSANIQLQRTIFSSSLNPYQATSIAGFITHRF